MDGIDSTLKSVSDTANSTSSTLTTFQSGYATVLAAIAANSSSKNMAKSTPWTPTSDWHPYQSYVEVNGTSVSFTASGESNLAIYAAFLPVSFTSAQSNAKYCYYLTKDGSLFKPKEIVTFPGTAFQGMWFCPFIIENPASGTYALQLRTYDTTYGYIGCYRYMDGVPQVNYRTVQAIMFEL
jgi:hypothetical protein